MQAQSERQTQNPKTHKNGKKKKKAHVSNRKPNAGTEIKHKTLENQRM